MRLEYKPEGTEDLKENKEEHVLSQGNAVNDEIRKQGMKMKDKPFKEKFSYFMDYYKWPVIGIIGTILILCSLLKGFITHKDYCFYAMIINAVNVESSDLNDNFAEYAKLDVDNYECYIDAECYESITGDTADVGTTTRYAAMLTTGDLDITVYNSDLFYKKALANVYLDLRKVLSPELIAKYQDKFYYMDQKEIDNAEDDFTVDFTKQNSGTDYDELLADVTFHMNPQNMQEPVPVGIVILDSKFVRDLECYYNSIPVFGIMINTQRQETAVAFLEYIFDENVDFSQFYKKTI